ncbi:MAG: hypothetical protein KF730_02835 [Sphingomonas sp.]|uniref:hypothetical protein n=1 Tax=Sphingomonas sp. TaxID=28214 RepID=UPI0025E960F1|nr:hypothetical protein [Sphingomonas sp.]MBX3563492.1 hypothetical protein [Sphingomonas sp.]
MIRQLLFLALASASLGSCNWGASEPPPPPPPHDRPRPVVEPPFDWIAPDPECRGQMRRGEWLVCDNKNLRYLHRTLATEWANARQGAERGALRVMQRQQIALLSERNRCEDAACVATAYRRYLSGYSRPEPRPTWTPAPRPPVKVRPRHPRPPRDWNQGGWRDENWGPRRRRGEQSCAAEVGGSASAYLVRQCRVVNGRWDRGCTADMTCDDLREAISDGCSNANRRPGFCNRR